MKNRDDLWEADFQKCVEFHGHACPGLALGYVAAKAALAWLGERRSEDEEIVAIVETDACGADALQVVTGCTFGKGNFFFKDYGKTAFSVLSRSTGKGIRLYAKPNGFRSSAEYHALTKKVSSGEATEEEVRAFHQLQAQRTHDVLKTAAEDLYDFQEVTSPLPPHARILDSSPCSRCGELAMASRLTKRPEGLLCRSCLAEVRRLTRRKTGKK
jgi:formylmethanofuran dehydrogenase subunit E